MRYRIGLSAGAVIGATLLGGCWPTGDVGYLQIKTVPVAPVTQTALYVGSAKLAPIKQGGTILRQPVGTLRLQGEGYAPGALTPLCDIEVRKNRITTVIVSVLEHPPRCVCRFTGTAAAAHLCVS